jgi:peptidyl-tRNA hydrolase
MGIDRPDPGHDVVSYVLGRFAPAENDAVEQALDQSLAGIEIYCRDGIDRAMHEAHSR